MRNPLPHLALAVTLLAPALAAAAPGQAAPLAFKRDDWKVVEPAGTVNAEAIKKTCPTGALATTKTSVAEAIHSFRAKVALNVPVALYCVQFNESGQATVSPIDSNVLELTLYKAPFSDALDYRLNRGMHGRTASPSVAVRDPGENELKPAAKADARFAAVSDDEKYWLAKKERDDYEKQSTGTLAPEKRLALETATRQEVAKHLPSWARPEYKKLTAAPIDPKKVSAYLDGLIAIRDPEDLKKLAAIKKGKGLGAHLQRDDAREEYEGQMSTVKLGPDQRPLPGAPRDSAVEKVAKFRGLLIAHAGKTPSKTPSGHAPSTAVVNLTAAEQEWLTSEQVNAYADAKAALGKSSHKDLNKQYRDLVSKNLPPAVPGHDYAGEYAAAVEKMTPAALDGAIRQIPHYSGTDTELIKEEIAALAAITKDKVPAPYKIGADNAQIEYTRLMQTLPRKGGVLAGNAHLRARNIVTEYRAMLAAANIVVPGAPKPTTPADVKPANPGDVSTSTSPVTALPGETKLSGRLVKLLTAEEKAAYDKEVADAKGDDKKLAAVYTKYRKILAVRDMAAYNSLSPAQQKDLCAPYKDAVLNQGGASVATAACAPEVVTQKRAACKPDKKTGKVDEACVRRATAECGDSAVASGATSAPASSLPPITDPKVKEACVILNDNSGGSSDPSRKPSVTTAVPDPCGGDAAKDGGAAKADKPGDKPGTAPGNQSGSDKDTCPKKDPGNPAFFKNLANATAFGVFGLILGSFFGGPLVMAAAALLIGGGAYALSSHLNPKPKKDDK